MRNGRSDVEIKVRGIGQKLTDAFEQEAIGDSREYALRRMRALIDSLADIPDASRVIGSALMQARANNERRERMAREVA